MRKSLFIALAVLFSSCTNEDTISYLLNNNNETLQQDECKRSFEEALEIANQSIGMFESSETRSASSQRKISLKDTKYVIKESLARSSGQDTLMYIFNFENNEGFSIISANKATDALLLQTEQGTYDDNTRLENPAFDMYMDMAESYLSDANGIPSLPPTPPDEEFRVTIDTVETTYIGPKISTKWGQTGYEATYTPNGYSGCSNTAMAQVMSYFCHPTQIAINYPGATISSLTLNWQSIKSHKVTHVKQTCNAGSYTHDAIGHLHRQLGHLNYATYNPNGTGTSLINARNTFSMMGYSVSDFIPYSEDDFTLRLSDNYLYIMQGTHQDGTNTGTHAWVIDGSLKYKTITREWTKSSLPGADWAIIREYPPHYSEYYHINWGWDGNCNGFFNAGVFATNMAMNYDNKGNLYNNTTNQNYQYNIYYFRVKK